VAGQWTVGDQRIDVADVPLTGRVFDAEALARGVRFVPTSTAPYYVSYEVAGIPLAAPAPDTSQIDVRRTWYTTDGKPWDGGTLEEGDTLIVQLNVRAAIDIPDALVTDLLPAGLEIENFNLGDAKQWADVVIDGVQLARRDHDADLRHEEFRDDRYVAALKLRDRNTTRLFYLVRAVSPGTYTVPPPLVEDMYRPDVRGTGFASPETITVTQPGAKAGK